MIKESKHITTTHKFDSRLVDVSTGEVLYSSRKTAVACDRGLAENYVRSLCESYIRGLQSGRELSLEITNRIDNFIVPPLNGFY